MKARGNIFALFAGALFAVGLTVSGMTLPSKVIGFLDFTGSWDPSLLLVMVGGLLVYGLGSRLVMRRGAALDGGEFEAPPARGIDARLVTGAALFGLGWGLGGFCPGPAIVSMGPLALGAILFVGGMFGGQLAFEIWDRRQAAAAAPQSAAVETRVEVKRPTEVERPGRRRER